MTPRRFIAGLLLSPLVWAAAPAAASAQSMFDQFFSDAALIVGEPPVPDDRIVTFVVREMEDWRGDGILLFPSDVTAALNGDVMVLCNDKFTFQTLEPIDLFSLGGVTNDAGCDSLINAIRSLVEAEMEIDTLGDILTVIANGGELALSDQPNRPANIGFGTTLTTRVWTGTGAQVIPWPEGANSAYEELDRELAQDGNTPELLDAILWTYQHGYFRSQREADTNLQDWDLDGDGDGQTVGDKLAAVAAALGIDDDDYKEIGEFPVPKINTTNVGMWARADDVGLMWVYPDHFLRMMEIEEADEYPEYNEDDGDRLAYPWTYEGTFSFGDKDNIKSPVCTRTAGRLGYLCRNVEEPVDACDEPENSDALNLVRCDQEIRETKAGPELCPGIVSLFMDDGTPLADPADPRFINPDLTEADKKLICDPENKVLYKDEIMSHACYIAFCVAQSHSGHTLVSNRSPNLASEATSPYLACMRRDPHLGLYAELAQMTPFALPSYIGHHLAQEYEREYCAITGLPPHPLAGFCTYRENRRANSPLYILGVTTNSAREELAGVREDQDIYLADATVIGYRLGLDQWLPVQRKMVETMANSVQETATLLRELANAPLTKTPCPWTGPFPRSASSAAP